MLPPIKTSPTNVLTALLAILLVFAISPVTSQLIVTTATVTAPAPVATSAALNTASAASVAQTAPSVAQTTVPDLDLSGASVPFLLQRPIPQIDDDDRNRFVHPRVKDIFFTACDDDGSEWADPDFRINVSVVYAQFQPALHLTNVLASQYPYHTGVLRIDAVGATNAQGRTANQASNPPLLSTLQVMTDFLTFNVFTNISYLCDHLYPVQPDPQNQLIVPAGCLYGPGQVAVGVTIPLNDTYTLGTLSTRIRLSDTSSLNPKTIACLQVQVNPYTPSKWYWSLILWWPIGLTIGYFLVIALARIMASVTSRAKAFKHKAREGSQPNLIKDTIAPTIIASLSGQQLAFSAALLRFATPSCWDIVLHTQFVAALAMIAVRWPEFVYPFFKQAAWASLVGNVTIIRSISLNHQSNLLYTNATLPTGEIGTQIGTNTSSTIYMDPQQPNHLLNLQGARTGIQAFAHVVGLQPGDLFGTCVSIWLIIVAIIVGVSIVFWLIDSIHDTFRRVQKQKEDGLSMANNEVDVKQGLDHGQDGVTHSSTSRKDGYKFLARPGTRLIGSSNNSIHFNILHGNLSRALFLFHLPVTTFTTHHMTHAASFSLTSVALAGLSFAFLSVLFPFYLIFRISRNPTPKLYDSIGTLSALGPVYNTYSPGSQLFAAVDFAHTFILGVVIGAGQKSGTAQAIIIVIVETLFALACSLWLPWGDGAVMGPISFVASVLRIITAVLVLLLTPLVNFGRQPLGWLTYVILLIQAIIYVCATLILLVKIIEGLVRLFGGCSFGERASTTTSGLSGAIRKIRKRKDKIQLNHAVKRDSNNLGAVGSPDKQARPMLAHTSKSGSIGNYKTSATTPTTASPPKLNQPLPSSGNGGRAHSRQASYASYLDGQLYPRKSPVDYLNDTSSPYSTYFRGDPNDEGYIMAALPPTVAATRPALSGLIANAPGRASSPPPATGFVRTGGGRATDSSPYKVLSGQNSSPTNGQPAGRPGSNANLATALSQNTTLVQKRTRPQSQSAIVETFYDKRASFVGLDSQDPSGKGNKPASAQSTGVKHYSSGTPLAPSASIAGITALEGGGMVETSKKKGRFWRRASRDDDSSSDDDDDDDDDAFKGPSNSQGAWRGISKMSAALTALSNRLTGKATSSDNDEVNAGTDSLEPTSDEPTRSKGFEVVRAPRPRKILATAEQNLDSTALAAKAASNNTTSNKAGSRLTQSGQALYHQPAFDDSTFDPSTGTLPPGANQQALLLPQLALRHGYQHQPSADLEPINTRSEKQHDEDTYWVSSNKESKTAKPEKTTFSTKDPIRNEPSLTSRRSGASLGRLAEPMSAQVFDSADDLPERIASSGNMESSSFLEAQQGSDTTVLNRDAGLALSSRHPARPQTSSALLPQPQREELTYAENHGVWDASLAYGRNPN